MPSPVGAFAPERLIRAKKRDYSSYRSRTLAAETAPLTTRILLSLNLKVILERSSMSDQLALLN